LALCLGRTLRQQKSKTKGCAQALKNMRCARFDCVRALDTMTQAARHNDPI
jgi:hypothetical protein